MSRKIYISESELISLLEEVVGKIKKNSEVEKVQNELKSKGYDLGKYGVNKDGVDGVMGKLTKKAMFKEFEKSEDFKNKYKHLIHDYDEINKKIELEKVNVGYGSSKNNNVILLGGLDNRPGDKNIETQINMVKNNLGFDTNVVGYRYFDVDSVLNSLGENPDSFVILFSAGCKYSEKIAGKMKDKSKLYIVEPYALGKKTKGSVQSAVEMGVPSTNVITGPKSERGNGVVSNTTKTPNNLNHWGSLEFASSLIS